MRKHLLLTIVTVALGVSISGAAFARGSEGRGSLRSSGVAGGSEGHRRFDYYSGGTVGLWGYYDPFWFGDPWLYPDYTYPGAYGEPTGSVRLEVKPKTAQVYVDGYYAGAVTDFDGYFDHLNLMPGGHRIEMRAPGYQTLTVNVYVQPGHTTDWKGNMVPERANS
jgi:hypothetical protein